MRIGIIGAGMIGGTAARLFAAAGHDVILSNSRGPASLGTLVDTIGPRASAATVAQAARTGEVVLLAVPWRAPEALPPAVTLAGKVVVDAMNPYAEDGGIIPLDGTTSSEDVARRLPGARLVKAFNTIWWQHLATQARPELPRDDRRAIFVAGDDAGAKDVVARLIEEIGFGAVDAGTLRDGARLEPGAPVYNKVLTAAEAERVLAQSR